MYKRQVQKGVAVAGGQGEGVRGLPAQRLGAGEAVGEGGGAALAGVGQAVQQLDPGEGVPVSVGRTSR